MKMTILGLRKRLGNNAFIRNIAVVSAGNSLAKLIGIASMPVITRLYSPEEYGVYSIFASIATIVGALSTLRYSVTIPLAHKESTSLNLLKLCLIVSVSFSVFLCVVLLLFGNLITGSLAISQISPYLWVLPITIFFSGVYQTLESWAVRQKEFKIISETKVVQGLGTTLAKVGLGFLGIRPLGLLIGIVAEKVAGVFMLINKFKNLPSSFFKISMREIWSLARRYKKFPLIQSWSQILVALGAQLPVLLVGGLYGIGVAGVFGMAMNMVSIPMVLLGQSVAQVHFAEISKYGRCNPKKVYHLSLSIIKNMFFIGILPVAMVFFFGPWLFKIVFGADWLDAGIFARLIAILTLARFISSPIANILNVYEKQWIQIFLNFFLILVIIISFLGSRLMGLSPFYSVGVFSLAATVYRIGMAYIILRVVWRECRHE